VLEERLAQWTRGQDKHLLADRLAAAGVPAEPVNDGRDVFTDHELVASGHFTGIAHAVLGACEMPGPPARFSTSEIQVGAPPMLGEHNHQVFVEMLGLDATEIDTLTREGALA
jgi:benzylsuccinate CoA-transferase BbsF subunit